MFTITMLDASVTTNFMLSVFFQLPGLYVLYLLSRFVFLSLKNDAIERVIQDAKLRTLACLFSSRVGKFLVLYLACLSVLILLSILREAFRVYDIRALPSRDILTIHLVCTSLLIGGGLYVFLGNKGLLIKIDEELSASIDARSVATFHLRKKHPKINVALLTGSICGAIERFSVLGFDEFYFISWRLSPKQERDNLVVKELRKGFRKIRMASLLVAVVSLVLALLFFISGIILDSFSGFLPEYWESAILALAKVASFVILIFYFEVLKVSILLKVVPTPIKNGVLESSIAKDISTYFAVPYAMVMPRPLRLSTFFTLSIQMPHINLHIGGVESGFVIKK